MAEPFQVTPEGVRLVVRLTPRAGRDGLDGVATTPDTGTHLRLRLSAPPVEGAANAALIAFLARALGLRKSDIHLLAGERSRVKRLLLVGDGPALAQRVAAWIALST